MASLSQQYQDLQKTYDAGDDADTGKKLTSLKVSDLEYSPGQSLLASSLVDPVLLSSAIENYMANRASTHRM